MNPRALAGWSACALTVSLLTNNPAYRVLVALAAVNLLSARGRPGRSAGLVRLALWLAAAGIVLNLLLGHSGAHVLARIPGWIPLLGGPITLESLAFGASTALGVLAAVLSVAPITVVGEVDEMVDALPWSLQRTGEAVAAALNLVPALGRSLESVRDAQRMRGWRPRRLGTGSAVLLPVTLSAIESSVSLAEAMESRGYGSTRRTRWGHDDRWTRADTATVAGALVAAAAFLLAQLLAVAVDWHPFPTLTAPHVEPLLALACLGLLVPSVTWSRASGT